MSALASAVLLVAVLSAVGGCGSAAPVVKKVDHLVINSEDPKKLFELMTGTLGLPVAWPFTEYPGFATGGVQVGNVNIEVLHFGPASNAAEPKAFLYGIVLEPYPLAQSVPDLAKRGAGPGEPEVQMTEVGGAQVPAWTNVTLEKLCGPAYTVYLCEYTPEMKERLSSRQASGALGLLGITGVESVVIAATDAPGLQKAWSAAMAPSRMTAPGVLTLGSGPAIRVVSGAEDALDSLVFTVDSVTAAEEACNRAGVPVSLSEGKLTIGPNYIQGLRIVMAVEGGAR